VDTYGSDKPDTRFDIKLEDYSDDFRDSGFLVFEREIDRGGVVKGIRVPELLSRSEIEKFERIVKRGGFKGLVWLKSSSELSGPLAPRLPEKAKKKFTKKHGTFLLLAGPWLKVCTALGNVRLAAAEQLGQRKGLSVMWVTDFPLFEWSDTEKRVQPAHHPFTSPKKGYEAELDLRASDEQLLKIPSRAYDLVVNGVEVGGGSIRITDRSLQEKMLRVLGINHEEAEEKFGMLVIAFPKSKSGRALMEGAPAKPDAEGLEELGIKVEKD
jgi:aspartyl-tRNA synthetase